MGPRTGNRGDRAAETVMLIVTTILTVPLQQGRLQVDIENLRRMAMAC